MLCIAMVFALAAPSAARAAAPYVTTRSAIITTRDGVVMWSHRGDSPRPVASTIKLLNALVVREHTDLDEVVVVSKAAERIDNGEVFLEAGQKITVRQLLEIMLVCSANDAAEALAVHVAGSEKKFVKMMNAKADELGLEHTRAADPHGLSKRERASAADMAVIGRTVLKDPVLRKMVRTKYCTIPRKNGSHWHKRSTDRLLGTYRGIEGMKTGFTNPAGYCFVGAAKRNGVELVAVVLGGDSSDERFGSMRRLLNWGFAHACSKTVASRDTTVSLETTGNPEIPNLVAHAKRDVKVTVPRSGSKVTRRVKNDATVELPVSAGQRVGTLELLRGSTVLAEVPLLSVIDVPAAPARTAEPRLSPAAQASPLPGVWERAYGAVVGFVQRVAGALS